MAPTTTTPKLKRTKLVCFSFAAYAKTLIHNININLNIPIFPGLTDQEFTSLESTFGFSFPPDLRAILQEGLPIGPLFPNWRSSSPQQLKILLNLPFLNLSRNILHNTFWVDSWGPKPDDSNQALDIAKSLLDKAPVLVPIYGNCYIPSLPNAAGNPVFYVDGGCVRVLSFDISGFFEQLEFFQTGGVHFIRQVNFAKNDSFSIIVPAWAATAARRIEFWTEVTERGRKLVARDDTGGWWSSGGLDYWELGSCLEEVFWRLRDGGWREEEVREMMMMMDGCDDEIIDKQCGTEPCKEDVAWHVRVLSLVLLRAGWSREDIVYSLDLQDNDDICISKCSLDFQIPNSRLSRCSRDDGDHQSSGIKHLMNLRSLEV